jgi:HAD superfamily hydrolase (TIGR01459 family)
MTADLPVRITGFAAIAERFDGVILDQWGVLHDGVKAPAGAIDAVARMAAGGKRLVVLSNSARLADDAHDRLLRLGYDPTLFAGFVTSGATVRDMLRDRQDPFFAALGRSVLLIARDDTLIAGLDYVAAQSPEQADFVLLGSSTSPERSLAADHAPVLARAAARGLPLVCANPDKIGVAGTGFTEGPGTLAAHYQALGGRVRSIGKPHPEVYARARAFLDGVQAGRIIAIGDSLEHDIAGGAQAGLSTLLIEAGIHAADIAGPDGLTALCRRFAAVPDYRLPRLVW